MPVRCNGVTKLSPTNEDTKNIIPIMSINIVPGRAAMLPRRLQRCLHPIRCNTPRHHCKRKRHLFLMPSMLEAILPGRLAITTCAGQAEVDWCQSCTVTKKQSRLGSPTHQSYTMVCLHLCEVFYSVGSIQQTACCLYMYQEICHHHRD